MTDQQLQDLIAELRSIGRECEWSEFKCNNERPEEIAEYISAMSNSAAMAGVESAYLVWGIRDETLDIVGTRFDPSTARKGNEPLFNWLMRSTLPQLDFQFFTTEVSGHRVVVLKIPRAPNQPVRFGSEAFIRVDSQKRKLKDYPEHARKLWASFDTTTFEAGIAKQDVDGPRLLQLLDFSTCFDKLGIALPADQAGILGRLCDEQLAVEQPGGRYDITNLGAILFAKNLSDFGRLGRKSIRVVKYSGDGRFEIERQWEDAPAMRGYAMAFEAAVAFVNSQVKQNEPIGEALRAKVKMYPEIAIRELVGNAIIHQDFSIRGTGPLIEIFEHRIEVTSPGQPLLDPIRFIDGPPRSRNESLAAMARRLNMCEELGTGIDKVIEAVEIFQLPPPVFETPVESTRSTLLAHKPLDEMTREERIRACLQHACLCIATGEQMSNKSVRKRFGLDDKQSAKATRIINETLETGDIKPVDPTASRKYMRYVPSWC
ncbi:ATP-binding protein [Neorhodopirellula lusitana]|uniref:ATP-binding protein n=1 Tax=Neorhodopirellula lusitana TaxID=445327 RepID=UPI00384DA6E2